MSHLNIDERMMKILKNVKLIVTDIDGTLLQSDGTIGERTKYFFEKAHQLGIHTAIATGRPLTALPQAVLDMPCFEYIIACNGTCIFHLPTGKLVYDCKMPEGLVRNIVSVFKESGYPVEAVIEGKAYVPEIYYNNPLILQLPEHMVSYVQSTRYPIRDIYTWIEQHINTIETLVLVIDDPEKKDRIRQKIETFDDIYVTTSADYYIECNHINARKGYTMQKLGSLLHIATKQMIAFGDSENDLDMLVCAGISVAMGNASETVKQAADMITLDNNHDGIADILALITG